MKLKYKIEEHYSAEKQQNKFYIFGYDRLGNKYDTMWSTLYKDKAIDMLQRLKPKKRNSK